MALYTMSNIWRPLLLIFSIIKSVQGLGEVLYAINAGGESHIDVYGIRYEKDPLTDSIGTASDFGKQLIIRRVPPGDQILYQTERYHYSTFGYEIPLDGNGDYVIVLKFCEVYFNSADQKVFDVLLNGDVTVISSLDIFAKVGRGVAHDEYITFTNRDNVISVNGQQTKVRGNKAKIEFVKGSRDNPKVNAIYVIKGRIEDVPKLPLVAQEEEEKINFEESTINPPTPSAQKRRPSGPKTPDPYEDDKTSALFPVFIAIGAALPILFCLCRL